MVNYPFHCGIKLCQWTPVAVGMKTWPAKELGSGTNLFSSGALN